MTNNELTARVGAILMVLEEMTGGTSESMLYLFFDTRMDDYQLARRMMLEAGWIAIKHNWVELTPKGREVAEKINVSLAAAKEAR